MKTLLFSISVAALAIVSPGRGLDNPSPEPEPCYGQWHYVLEDEAMLGPFNHAAAAWTEYLKCQPFAAPAVGVIPDSLPGVPNKISEIKWINDALPERTCLIGMTYPACRWPGDGDILLSAAREPLSVETLMLHELGHGWFGDVDGEGKGGWSTVGLKAPNIMHFNCLYLINPDGTLAWAHNNWKTPNDEC